MPKNRGNLTPGTTKTMFSPQILAAARNFIELKFYGPW